MIEEPLLSIRFFPSQVLDLSPYQGFICTSRHGVQALSRTTSLRHIPVYTVGDASAQVAKDEGFQRVVSAAGGIRELISHLSQASLPTKGPLFYASGAHTSADIASLLQPYGFSVHRHILYEANPAPCFSTLTVKALEDKRINAVGFFSARTATIFHHLAVRYHLIEACQNLNAVCLSKAIADVLTSLEPPLRWRRIHTAYQPCSSAMTDLLHTLASPLTK